MAVLLALAAALQYLAHSGKIPLDNLAESIVKRCEAMAEQRNIHVEVWRKCYRYSYPLRMHGFFDDVVTANDGLAKLSQLNDSTTTEAVRVFASHLIEGMTPANAIWFGLDVGQESEDEKRWLSMASKTIWENIHNANFDSITLETAIDVLCAGWFVLYVDEKPEGGYHFEQWPLSECYIASSRMGAPIDTIYRKFQLRADQAVNQYGDAVSSKIKEAIENGKPHEKFSFLHAIYPRTTYVVGSRLAKNMPIASVHVELTDKRVLRESGYHEMPCMAPRWMLIPGTPYAVGAVYDALPDAATINKVKEMELANMDMAVGGLWIAEDDGVLTPKSLKIGPRRVIVANSVDSMKPLQPSTNFNVTFVAEDRIQAQIRKLLLADVLPPLEGQPRTATEINMRIQYIRQMLGPVFGRLQSEYLQPLIERCFGIAYRAGILGQPPETLNNRTWHVKYKSPLARAQQLSEVNAIDQYMIGLAQTAELDPSALDNIDMDKAHRYRAEALGVPAELIPSTEDVREKRMAKEQARQQMNQEQVAMQVAADAGKSAARGV